MPPFWPAIILWNRDKLRASHIVLRVAFVAGLVANIALALTLLAMSDSEMGYALAIFSALMGLSALVLYFWRGLGSTGGAGGRRAS